MDRQVAVALKYTAERDMAPRIVAKGRGPVAESILRIAEEAGVPVHEDADLATVLAKLDLEAEIPPELYQVIAEILAFIYKLNQEKGDW
ncbi:MAG: EscU/YscU/HrcU family type III secretion system export apparatus switch protein [Planctomycetota bacterium]|jgi:flagellar biosynthesis protein